MHTYGIRSDSARESLITDFDPAGVTSLVPVHRGAAAAPIHILVADAHPIVDLALSEWIQRAYAQTAVASCSSVARLMVMLHRQRPDLLILDLQWPGPLQGIALLAAAMGVAPGIRIVVHTADMHPLLALAAFDLGVQGYVLKTSSPQQVLRALPPVLRNRRSFDPALDLASARAHPWYALSDAERNVLIALANGQSLVDLSMKTGRSYKTVAAQKYTALDKLGLKHCGVQIRAYFIEQGLEYLLAPVPPSAASG